MLLTSKVLANQILAKIKDEISFDNPSLSILFCTDDPASQIYVKKKLEACKAVGIFTKLILPHRNHDWEKRNFDILDELITKENSDGILVQLPLPIENKHDILEKIDPYKDVDCLTSANIGLALHGRPRFLACTPNAIIKLLKYYEIPLDSQKVTIINRSDIIGKPLFALLVQENATVCMCHDHTKPEDLKESCLWADIIVVAVGKKGFLTKEMVRKGQTIIDVGVSRVEGKVYGDVEEGVEEVVSNISKCVGGVGPLTVACLLENTVKAYRLQS